MKKILAIVFHPLLLLAVGLACLAALIWWMGPLLAFARWRPLETELARQCTIGGIVLWAVLWQLFKALRRHGRDQALLAGLKSQAAAQVEAGPADAELETLRKRFDEAIKTLREAGLTAFGGKPRWRDLLRLSGRQYLYQLPWYMFVGAPGSGKTTALMHSGLHFPLADRFGTARLQGVGGTRNCDWWFTDEAVLIDTAGRYTTQDSDASVDPAAWKGFLALLRKTRPRQPLNGVLLTLNVQDLLSATDARRSDAASALQARIRELSEAFGMRVPIYVLVTKADLLAGFDAFFANLPREEREQVLGFTVPLDQPLPADSQALAERVDHEIGLLGERLVARTLARMEEEPDSARRAEIFGFPMHFLNLKPVLAEFIADVFAFSRFNDNALLRGVYFTSGTQEGTPIDRIQGTLASAFGLPPQAVHQRAGSGKSFFITRLLRDVIFQESGLADANLAWARRRHWLRMGCMAVMALVAVALLVAWGTSYMENRRYVAAVQQQTDAARQALASLSGLSAPELVTILPALNSVHSLASTQDVRVGAPSLSMQWGLWQGSKLDAGADAAYRNLLHDLLLPRIAARIEEMVRGAGPGNAEFAYEALKAYLSLHQPEHQDPDALKGWIMADWERSLPRDVSPAQREELLGHLNALFDAGPLQSTLAYDPVLVASVRSMLSRQTLYERVYGRLKRSGVGADYPPFTIAKVAGPNATLVFSRGDDKSLSDGVPGLYTADAYRSAFLKAVDGTALQLAREEPWVLGSQSGMPDAVAMQRLTEDVRRLYLEAYARTWSDFLASVRLVHVTTLQQAIQVARILSAPDSPLVAFVQAASRQTTLSQGPQADASMLDKAGDKVRQARDSAIKWMGADDPTRIAAAAGGARLESIVDDRFTALRALATAPQGQAAPIAQIVGQIGEVYTYLSATESALQTRATPPPSDVPTKLAGTAGRMPDPVRGVLQDLSTAGAAETQQARRTNITDELNASVSGFCKSAIAGRYPFSRGSATDVRLEDFGKLFGPGGTLDTFFQKTLAADVDTSTRPWAFKRIEGSTARATAAGLIQFERAAVIRDVFFRAGGSTPTLKLEFRPVEMDPSILQFVIDVDGQVVRYAHGPQMASTVQWPGPRGAGRVSLQLTPPPSQNAQGLAFEGQWALFRMFDQVQIEPSGQPERFQVTFNVEGRKARFEVTASSVLNPFRLPDLRAFACPTSL